nr:serine hydrolase [Pedobacter panaciterrae]
MKKTAPYLLSILFFFAKTISAQSTISKKKIDSVLSSISNTQNPGLSVGIIQKGKIVYSNGFGLADLNTKRKNTSATRFNICSVSKQFTAACIYLLEEQGKLKTSDHLSKYFKDLPAYADTITIDQLIHHQSGIKDFTTLLWLRDMEENGKTTDQQAYATLSRQSLNFPAGDQESYTNSGYFFLSKIVSIVSGQDLSQFAKTHLFNPLKMANTGFSRSHLVQNKANGYILEDNKYIQYNPQTSIIGHSNVYSPITDWDKWFNEMKNHRVLGDKIWKKILTPAINNNGNQIDYAGGVRITTFQNQKIISHGGDLPSYHSYMAFFPEKDLGIIIMSNNGTFSGYDILNRIYNDIYPDTKPILVKEESEKPIEEKAVNEFNLNVSTLPYAGSYLIEGSQNMVFDVLSKDSSLTVLQKWNQHDYPILPLNDSLFYIKGEQGITFEFRQSQNSHTQKMLITQQGKPSWAKRIEPEKEDTNTLSQYCGNFYSPEIDAHYTILINNGSLNMKIGSSTQKITSSGNKDYYYLPETGMEFNFRRNESHQIDGLILNHVRVEKLLFLKE